MQVLTVRKQWNFDLVGYRHKHKTKMGTANDVDTFARISFGDSTSCFAVEIIRRLVENCFLFDCLLLFWSPSLWCKWHQLSSSNNAKYKIILFWTRPHMVQHRSSRTSWNDVGWLSRKFNINIANPNHKTAKYLDYYYYYYDYAHHQALTVSKPWSPEYKYTKLPRSYCST